MGCELQLCIKHWFQPFLIALATSCQLTPARFRILHRQQRRTETTLSQTTCKIPSDIESSYPTTAPKLCSSEVTKLEDEDQAAFPDPV